MDNLQTGEQNTQEQAYSAWGEPIDTMPASEQGVGDSQSDTNNTAQGKDLQEPKPVEPTFDANAFVKEHFGFDDVDSAKQKLSQWQEMEKQSAAPKFANEESEALYKLIAAGELSEASAYIEKAITLSKVDEMSASEALKMQLKLSNSDYNEDDVEDIFEEKYATPEKPSQEFDEDDEDYQARLGAWQKQVDKISRRMERDAVSAREYLRQQKPNISLSENSQQTQQQEGENAAKVYEEFVKAVDEQYTNFEGFATTVKKEGLTLPEIKYAISEEEKSQLKEAVKNFDANTYWAKRWFAEDGKPKVTQIMSDIYQLENGDKIRQKIANESADQAILAYSAGKRNISVTEQPVNNANFDQEQLHKALAEQIWS